MRVIDCAQNTPEWHAARCGKVTASRIADIMRKTKSGVSAMRETYMAELVAERLTGIQEDGYCSDAMQHGKNTEDEAARVYAFERGVKVEPVGFVLHPTLDNAGCSPDRLTDDGGLLQIKCPATKTHIATLTGKAIAPDYFKQMQMELLCTGRMWCDFVSFDPRMPVELQLHVTRVHRCDETIDEVDKAAEAFLSDLDRMEARLRALMRQEAA